MSVYIGNIRLQIPSTSIVKTNTFCYNFYSLSNDFLTLLFLTSITQYNYRAVKHISVFAYCSPILRLISLCDRALLTVLIVVLLYIIIAVCCGGITLPSCRSWIAIGWCCISVGVCLMLFKVNYASSSWKVWIVLQILGCMWKYSICIQLQCSRNNYVSGALAVVALGISSDILEGCWVAIIFLGDGCISINAWILFILSFIVEVQIPESRFCSWNFFSPILCF